jgi:uncharacterized membrane protein
MGTRQIRMKWVGIAVLFSALVVGCQAQQEFVPTRTGIAQALRQQPLSRTQELLVKEFEHGVSWTAFGTEPFWSLQQKDDSLFFNTPDFRFPLGFEIAKDSLPNLVGTNAGGSVSIRFSAGPCSDMMKDTAHPYSAQVAIRENGGASEQLSGCARFIPDFFLHGVWEVTHMPGSEIPIEQASWAFFEINQLEQSIRGRSPEGLFELQALIFQNGFSAKVPIEAEDLFESEIDNPIGTALLTVHAYLLEDGILNFFNAAGKVVMTCQRMP